MVKRDNVTKNVTKKCTVKKKKELKLSHKLFVAEYIANGGNATKAYMDTYPDTSYSTCMSNGEMLLRNTDIKEEIDKRLYSHTRKVELSSEDARRVLKEIIDFDPIELVNSDTGVPRELRDIPKPIRRALAGIDVVTSVIGDDETIKTYKFKFHNKLQATDQLHKLLGLYAEVQSIHEVQVRAICDLIWAAIRELAPELIPKIVAKFKELHSQVDPELLDPEGKNPVIVINRG